MLWCPALVYIGVRTRSTVDVTCGMLGTATAAYWVWCMIYR